MQLALGPIDANQWLRVSSGSCTQGRNSGWEPLTAELLRRSVAELTDQTHSSNLT
jgi:hypothetical protein